MTTPHPAHGQIGYLQLPAIDVERSAAFYERVFGWTTEATYGSFEAPGIIGQFTTELAPAARDCGPVVWICADGMAVTLEHAVESGGAVVSPPRLDQGARWLAEVDDPAGNRIGLVFPVRTAQSQTMLAVRDVEASSREGNGPAHREIWIRDPDGYTVVVASPDGEAYERSDGS